MDTSGITDWISGNLPEVVLLVGGLLAVLIAVSYVGNRNSLKYKSLTFLGLIFGIFMAIEAASAYGEWRTVTSVFVIVAAFTLIIRPFRDVHFSAIIALLVAALVYLWLGGLTEVAGIDVSFLAGNPVRLIAAFVVGALIYSLLNFAEAIVKMFGKLLNWWPLLLVLGVLCVIESVMMFCGLGSIMDYINTGLIISIG